MKKGRRKRRGTINNLAFGVCSQKEVHTGVFSGFFLLFFLLGPFFFVWLVLYRISPMCAQDRGVKRSFVGDSSWGKGEGAFFIFFFSNYLGAKIRTEQKTWGTHKHAYI